MIGVWMDEHADRVFWGAVALVMLVHLGGC